MEDSTVRAFFSWEKIRSQDFLLEGMTMRVDLFSTKTRYNHPWSKKLYRWSNSKVMSIKYNRKLDDNLSYNSLLMQKTIYHLITMKHSGKRLQSWEVYDFLSISHEANQTSSTILDKVLVLLIYELVNVQTMILSIIFYSNNKYIYTLIMDLFFLLSLCDSFFETKKDGQK